MAISKQFILAGDAVFTVELPAGAEKPHYTYRVQKVEANDRWPESFFVKLLTGPDNTSDYTYLGKLDPTAPRLVLTGKSKLPAEALPVRLLNRILARVWAGDHAAYEQHGYATHHEGRCGRCGRALTVPESVESGFGPECTKILAGAA